MIKTWVVEYDHKDGRCGTINVTTEVVKGDGFQYGNGMHGALTINGNVQGYDLRYSRQKDLHMAMLEEHFGKGLVKATEVNYVYEVLFRTDDMDDALIACIADTRENADILTKKWIHAFDESLLDPEETYGSFRIGKIRINSIGTDDDCAEWKEYVPF